MAQQGWTPLQLRLDLEWSTPLAVCSSCGKHVYDPDEEETMHSIGQDSLCDTCCPCPHIPMHHEVYGNLDQFHGLADFLEQYPEFTIYTTSKEQ